MTTTEPAIDAEKRSSTPALNIWLSLTPENVGGAVGSVVVISIPSHPRPVLRFTLGGVDCQTYACEPQEVADELHRLADAISEAMDRYDAENQ